MISLILSLILVEIQRFNVDSLCFRNLIDFPFRSRALLSDSGEVLVVLEVSLLEGGRRGCARG